MRNVTYKLITKILATRLKEIMPELVSQIQSSFVPSRQTSNNMLIVQEVVYTMRNKKGKTENMAIRIDLEKTYDQLS